MELVIVERSYPHPVTLEQVDAKLQGPNPCFQLRRVHHLLTVLSRDGRRALCFYRAPDAAAVREANDETQSPYERVWTGSAVTRDAELARLLRET